MQAGPLKFLYLWLPIYVVLIGLTLNNTMPYKGDENYYIGSAIEMIEDNSYALPQYFGQLRLQKPPLTYWLTIIGYRLFGIHLWSGRVIFLFLAFSLLIIIYRFSWLLTRDKEFSTLSVLILSSATLFIEFTRVSMTDMPLAFFTTLSLYYFCKAIKYPKRLKLYYTFAYISMGLAVLSKGLIGIIPFFAILIYLLATRPEHYQHYLLNLFHPILLLLFCFIAFSWYIYVYYYYSTEFASQLQKETSENLSFSLSTIFEKVIYYLKVLFTYYLPFIPLAIYLAIRKKIKLPEYFLPLLIYVFVTLIVLIFLVKIPKSRYMLVLFPVLTLPVTFIIYKNNLGNWSKKIAVIVSLLQISVFLVYPLAVGNPWHELIHHWETHLKGDLSAYGFSKKDTSWLQALSNGRLKPYASQTRYVLVEDKHLQELNRYEVIKEASRLSRLKFNEGRFRFTKRTFYLIGLGS